MVATDTALLRANASGQNFVMHLRAGATLPVLREVTFEVHAGECVVLDGPSGIGKSCILKMIFGNYRIDAGSILVRQGREWTDVARASPRDVLRLRQCVIGYISQFLRTIPRVGALDVRGSIRAGQWTRRGRCPGASGRSALRGSPSRKRLWQLPPATFSGGEQQRINIARGFVAMHPVLLLRRADGLALDQTNCAAVVEFIRHRKRAGTALVGIFHDEDVKRQVADRSIDVSRFRA